MSLKEPLIKTLSNKIGDLTGSGITESDLSTAIKNDRTQLSDIYVNVRNFGAKLDGTTDDTQAIINAEAYCNTNGKILFIPGLAKISSGITINSGTKGIIFDKPSYGSGSGSGLLVTGSGYTALTFVQGLGLILSKNITIHGGGNTCNGILFKGHAGIQIHENIRVYNLNGFGVQFNAIWDSVFTNISIEKCGNASNYAFSLNDDGDTCNHTVFNRLQVEQSNTKAMYVSPNTLNCTFIDIHSERTVGDGTNYTHILQGNECTYINARIENTSNVLILIGGSSYKDFKCSDATVNITLGTQNIITKIDNIGCTNLNVLSTNVSTVEIDNVNITGTLTVDGCKVITKGGTISNIALNQNTGYLLLKEIKIVTGSFTTLGGNNTLEAYDTTFANMPIYATVKLHNCTINNNFSTYYGQRIFLNNCAVLGNITLNSDQARIIAFNGTWFGGNCLQNTGECKAKLDESVICLGTVSTNWYGVPTGQSWNCGEKRYNPLPSAGDYVGYVCVTAGTPGTWKGFGLIST